MICNDIRSYCFIRNNRILIVEFYYWFKQKNELFIKKLLEVYLSVTQYILLDKYILGEF